MEIASDVPIRDGNEPSDVPLETVMSNLMDHLETECNKPPVKARSRTAFPRAKPEGNKEQNTSNYWNYNISATFKILLTFET